MMKLISGLILLLVGIMIFVSGFNLYRKAKEPDTCRISFVKALGGRSALAYDQERRYEIRTARYRLVGGSLLFLAGSVLVLRPRQRR